MDVLIVDKWRNARFAPDHPIRPGDDVLALLDDMLFKHPTQNGQIEIHCDGPFWKVMQAQVKRREALDPVPLMVFDAPWPGGHLGSYRGAPVLVQVEGSAR